MSKPQNPLPTCDPDLHPIAAKRSDLFTPRRAIDLSGRLGSLYDACRDQVLDKSNLNFSKQSAEPRSSPSCYVETCTTDGSQNLLKWYNIYHELRLSVALEMVPATGVGALINYTRPIDKYTRFICYTYYSRTEYFSDDEFKSKNRNRLSMIDALATHIIVFVNWSLTSVAILQLPPDDDLIQDIDHSIRKLCLFLSDDPTSSKLSETDMFYLKQIEYTEVFSNILGSPKINSILDFYRDIPQLKNDTHLHQPYNYNLCPIAYFYRETNRKQNIFTELQIKNTDEIERYLLPLSLDFKRLAATMDKDYANVPNYLKHELSKMRTSWVDLKNMYKSQIERLRDLVIDVRRGEIEQNRIHHLLDNTKKEELRKHIDDFDQSLHVIQEKENFISNLIQKHFEYQNAMDLGIKDGDSQPTFEHKLSVDATCKRIICSDDTLLKNNKSEWDKLHAQLLKEHEDNQRLRLVYVDFSNCSYKLDHFIIFPTAQTSSNPSIPKQTTSLPSDQRRRDDIINILLIGESGVGKSTFINAFVNYFQFDKLEKAQNNPIVLMPVSFIMTIGDDFEERLITFGGQDNVSNEDYDHPGQSVTQHCKSYVLTLRGHDDKEIKVRIIDTPGIGDVRGLGHDDINMQHIFSFINNLTHLNAICILMKPNNARLNIFFRSCFMQLFDFLGENAREKIIFCFTNTRSTFYTPGDTAPLLKQLLGSLPVKGTPFTKDNSFCFDSESFRYLVAVQNEIKFEDQQKYEYEDSWKKSSAESKRFLEYICTRMSAPLIPGEIESVRHVQLRISLMIRPMLEAMRNILRNIILHKESNPVSIELCSSIIKHRTAICLTCPRPIYQVGDFWITADGLHVFYNRCRTCACSPENHYPIDYELGYKPSQKATRDSDNGLTTMLNDICRASAEFGHFLSGEVDTSQEDPFLLGFKKMIKEEEDICKNKSPCRLNYKLLDQLKQLMKTYEDKRKTILEKKEPRSLPHMYETIGIVSKYPMMKSQMDAVKHWENYMIKYYEYEVRTPAGKFTY